MTHDSEESLPQHNEELLNVSQQLSQQEEEQLPPTFYPSGFDPSLRRGSQESNSSQQSNMSISMRRKTENMSLTNMNEMMMSMYSERQSNKGSAGSYRSSLDGSKSDISNCIGDDNNLSSSQNSGVHKSNDETANEDEVGPIVDYFDARIATDTPQDLSNLGISKKNLKMDICSRCGFHTISITRYCEHLLEHIAEEEGVAVAEKLRNSHDRS